MEGIVEKVPDGETGEGRVFYLPHKSVVREEAVTTKVRIVFDASARPSPMGNSPNECMYTGPALQPQTMGYYGQSKNVCTFVNRRLAKSIPTDRHSSRG